MAPVLQTFANGPWVNRLSARYLQWSGCDPSAPLVLGKALINGSFQAVKRGGGEAYVSTLQYIYIKQKLYKLLRLIIQQ